MIVWLRNKSNKIVNWSNRLLAPIDARIERNSLAVIILLITCSSKWIFEGLLAFAALQVFFIMVGVGLIVLKRSSIVPIEGNKIWCLYILSIFSSVIINGGSINVIGRAVLVALTIAYALYLECSDFDVEKALNFLTKIGIFHAIMVMLHFIFKGAFTRFYFPLLNPIDYEYALAYIKEGYYFGVLSSPHEVAGLIVFAVFSIICWNLSQEKAEKKQYALAGILLVPLFLTGKKGVLFCAAAATGISIMFELIINKKWRELKKFICISAAMMIVLVVLILLLPEVKVFYRLNQFFTRLLSGRSLDSARKSLYMNAVELWKDRPLFGVGWRQFVEMSKSRFGYRLAHQVNCDYLQWLSELGIIGFVLNMIPVSITFWRAVVICKDGLVHISDKKTKWIVRFALNTQLFILLYAFVEIPFYDIMFFSIYMLSCIIISSAYGKLKMGEILF